ncbi:TRAP transporter substrate-binding protein [Oceanibacterium hippocampi]|uniref:Lactate-binding periplasmic protein n=1 Tax=Oceanibacterium hippocampi TaxID=745714 RepID=A0A1Y5TUE7_9PROT|nr:TRAP transporter substrate-binding protein [Oceanibacterium hippocampi]SLN73068.1 Lactate-binding periplasmic protein precursor [Oceanibacterium hippocampi]
MTEKSVSKGRRRFMIASGAAPIALGLGAGSAKAEAQFSWRFQTLWAAGSINMEIFKAFCTNVGEMSGGRLTIEPLAGGSVVGALELYDAVQNGILDGQNGGGGYVAQKDIAFVMLGDLAGAYERPDQMQAWYEYGGGKELARELYAAHGTYHAGLVWHGMESIPSKVPIRGVSDLKGVKMRAPTGAVSKILQHFGGAPVNLPGGEVYTSLERGVLDATDWGTLSMNVDLGFEKVAPYALYPGFHSMPATDIVVNMDRWNALPDDLKSILVVATRDFGRDMYQRLMIEDQKIAQTAKDRGLELIDWPMEERRKFREAASDIWQELAADSPMARKIVDSQTTFLKQIGLLS